MRTASVSAVNMRAVPERQADSCSGATTSRGPMNSRAYSVRVRVDSAVMSLQAKAANAAPSLPSAESSRPPAI